MKKSIHLSDEDRNFFLLVDEAITTNPFSDQRLRVDLRIAGKSETFRIHQIGETIQKVHERITVLDQNGYSAITQFAKSDRKLMEHVYLFQFFYLFRKKFDQLILDQITAGETSIPVPFAEDIFTFFKAKGFHLSSIPRYIAMCYQIRRAFYFINRTLIGTSSAMKKLRYQLWDTIFTGNMDLYDRYMWDRMEDFSTIILGETGTGKGTAAMAIGRSGYIPFDEKTGCFEESFLKTFIAINLSQYPESLIESELFGYTKGAFTGAVKDHQGVFSRCSAHGAIFLDEIGEVSIPIQIKLLQVLHERIFYAVGSHQLEKFRGRVIAATNRSIYKLRSEGAFRDDFYYRLCSDVITVPSLRQRIAEDPKELDNLLSLTIERIVGRPSPELSEMVKTVIIDNLGMNYPWPGNVRELEQCVRNVLVGQTYKGDDKLKDSDPLSNMFDAIRSGALNAKELMAEYCHYLYSIYQNYE